MLIAANFIYAERGHGVHFMSLEKDVLYFLHETSAMMQNRYIKFYLENKCNLFAVYYICA